MPYKGTNNIDPNKVFLVNFSEVYGGRLDVDYYKPDIAYLEDTISSLSTKRLKDFCISVNGGATPKTDEQEKYYSDSEHGIPFLRVQNLHVSGELSLENCNYINEETHNGLLKRSQVYEGYLLVKITGVGRMAIASVAPNGFVGNINQHIVAIKTRNKEISKYLARYLNTDIVEKIASRHATGGTRPALDYPSLLNIPIIENIDFTPIDKAIQFREQKIKQAQRLQDSIDQYLLDELGITLPEKENSLENRLFTVKFSEVCGGRLDPKCYSMETKSLKYAVLKGTYECKPLKEFIIQSIAGDWGYDEDEEVPNSIKCLVIRATEFDNEYNLNLDNSRTKYRNILKSKLEDINLQVGDLLIEKSGGSEDQPVGRVAIITDEIMKQDNICYSNFIHKIRVTDILPEYLYCYLKTAHNIKLTDTMQSQTNGLRNLILSEYFNQHIPFPPPDKQREISENIAAIRAEAKRLELEGEEILESARQQVEQMILGDSCQSNGERKN